MSTVQHTDLYCNPASIPNLPLGMAHAFPGLFTGGYTGAPCDYREIGDPEVLPYEGKYYLYVSGRQVYVSEDLINWEYCPIEIDTPLGYAPAVTRCKDNIFITSSPWLGDRTPRIWQAKHPLGPFHSLGAPVDRHGNGLGEFLDPALFTDDDGRLYLYWGCAPHSGGIYGMEVDPDMPTRGISDIFKLIEFDENNSWEHFGDHGEIIDFGWDEGAGMYKYNGTYYLQYAACGTRFPNYSIGVYMSKSPLGPFERPAHCMAQHREGIVRGTGHGGMFTGPGGKPWQAYTVLLHRLHYFERLIGFDPVDFDEKGVPKVRISDVPCSVQNGSVNWVNAAAWKHPEASSCMPNSGPILALDECVHTCWVPEISEKEPWIKVDLNNSLEICAFRIIWAEQNADHKNGINYGPVKFKVEFFNKDGELLDPGVDESRNQKDLTVVFKHIEPVEARFVKLTLLRGNDPMHYGVSDFSVFVKPRRILD